MSDDNRRMKVSREGLILIKSFEGFRPRAERLDESRWVIGYGHTASAREGATVGEQDAELLLQYDLMPVVNALNERISEPLNQHQFDALASFAVSVGVERFLASDVLNQVNAGHPAEAAEALVRWPDADLPNAALRRRTAERALFVADPDAPIRLSDLLAAPLAATEHASEPAAAVEPEEAPAPIVEPTWPEPVSTEQPALTAPIIEQPQTTFDPAPAPTVAVEQPAFAPLPTSSFATVEEVATPEPVEPAVEAAPEAPITPIVFTPSATVASDAADLADFDASPFEAFSPPVINTLPPFEAPEAAAEPHLSVVDAPAVVDTPDLSTSPPAVDTDAFPALTPTAQFETLTPVSASDPGDLTLTPLVLTPPLETDFGPIQQRPVWSNGERGEGEEGDALPFDEPGLSIVRHEVDPDEPRRFDWSETGAFLLMGGVGLIACGASAAAFRLASRQNGDTSLIGWVLALIGLVCVGVSAWNLYVRWGRKG